MEPSIANRIMLILLVAIISSSALLTARDGVHLRYFPERFYHPLETLERWHYSIHLKAMYEPILSTTGKDNEYFAYRVLMLPSFEAPAAIRYEYISGVFRCRGVILHGLGGYKPGKIRLENSARLNSESLAELKKSVKQSGFWEQPEHNGHDYLDGTIVIQELIFKGRRHLRVQSGAKNIDKLFSGEFTGVGCWNKNS